MKRPTLVVIESPYAGMVAQNLEYARACMAHSIQLGEYPIASHLLYTQPGILDDDKPGERKIGIAAGFAWGWHADLIAFYVDRGWSHGMIDAGKYWTAQDKIVVHRRLGGRWA